MTQHLDFKDEKGSSRSAWVAVLFVLMLVGWMGSPMIMAKVNPAPEAEPAPESTPEKIEVKPVNVAVVESTARSVTEEFFGEGQAEAARDTAIRVETSGTVGEVTVAKGADVAEGAVLARIDPAQRRADLERARAEVTRTERDLANARALLDRGVATRDRVISGESAVAAARAGLAAAEEAMGNLEITAPFAGRIEAFDVEQGEFVGAGSEVGRIVDLSPLTVAVQVPQQSIGALKIGQMANVSFITGVERAGAVSFIGTSADSQTRTFTIEVTVENEAGDVPAGLSAQVRIPTGEAHAHFISPAILSLDTSGTLGVKAVGDGNTVEFYPVEILRAQTDGVWITGLPDSLTVITVGQGFVNAGEVVEPTPADLLNLARKADAPDDEEDTVQ